MFTGLVQAQGQIVALSADDADQRMTIDGAGLLDHVDEIGLGDSIAVNGVCLTALNIQGAVFDVDVSHETLKLTSLGHLVAGSRVNLETSLTLSRPLGGHLVSGHVDDLGRLESKIEDGKGAVMKFSVPKVLGRYIAKKGSICVDGVSLTVNAVEDAAFEVMVIPHTQEVTTLGGLVPGDQVNIEVDLLARYLERLSQPQNQ